MIFRKCKPLNPLCTYIAIKLIDAVPNSHGETEREN